MSKRVTGVAILLFPLAVGCSAGADSSAATVSTRDTPSGGDSPSAQSDADNEAMSASTDSDLTHPYLPSPEGVLLRLD